MVLYVSLRSLLEIHGSKIYFHRNIFSSQYCVPKCLVWIRPLEETFTVASHAKHYGTQLMPPISFLLQNWWHSHVCLQNKIICFFMNWDSLQWARCHHLWTPVDTCQCISFCLIELLNLKLFWRVWQIRI